MPALQHPTYSVTPPGLSLPRACLSLPQSAPHFRSLLRVALLQHAHAYACRHTSLDFQSLMNLSVMAATTTPAINVIGWQCLPQKGWHCIPEVFWSQNLIQPVLQRSPKDSPQQVCKRCAVSKGGRCHRSQLREAAVQKVVLNEEDGWPLLHDCVHVHFWQLLSKQAVVRGHLYTHDMYVGYAELGCMPLHCFAGLP